MAMIHGRCRSVFPFFNKFVSSVSVCYQESIAQRSIVRPSLGPSSQFLRGYAVSSGSKEENKVKVPLALFGGSGNYASALYLAAANAKVLDKVESEFIDFVHASEKSPTFHQFVKDLSVPKATRIKAINAICTEGKLLDITRNFLVLLAENGRLNHINRIAKKFAELMMARRGEVKATVTTVIPLPPAEEKELRETLRDILGADKSVKLEQKIDPGILGGIVVEFGQKVFDMSIKTRAEQMERLLMEPLNFDKL